MKKFKFVFFILFVGSLNSVFGQHQHASASTESYDEKWKNHKAEIESVLNLSSKEEQGVKAAYLWEYKTMDGFKHQGIHTTKKHVKTIKARAERVKKALPAEKYKIWYNAFIKDTVFPKGATLHS